MLQFYFLSIMLNLITGMILVYGKNFVNEKGEEKVEARPDDFYWMPWNRAQGIRSQVLVKKA